MTFSVCPCHLNHWHMCWRSTWGKMRNDTKRMYTFTLCAFSSNEMNLQKNITEGIFTHAVKFPKTLSVTLNNYSCIIQKLVKKKNEQNCDPLIGFGGDLFFSGDKYWFLNSQTYQVVILDWLDWFEQVICFQLGEFDCRILFLHQLFHPEFSSQSLGNWIGS